MENVSEANKFNLLVNNIDAAVYELIAEATRYKNAITILSNTYARTSSPIFLVMHWCPVNNRQVNR